MKFTQCPSCHQNAITSLHQLFKAEHILCSNCEATLIHSTRALVAILVSNLILDVYIVQFLVSSGLVVVIIATILFSLSIMMESALFVPLVPVKKRSVGKETSNIRMWYHSPIPYLSFFFFMVWLWHIYGRGT